MEIKYYLAYGSNLNLFQMRLRCPNAKPIGSSFLEGYELAFKGSSNSGVLTIEENPNSKIPIGVWEITTQCERALDIYEGYPALYRKEVWQVEMNGKLVEALIYIMNGNRELQSPSKRYLDIVLEGYQNFNFDRISVDKALNK